MFRYMSWMNKRRATTSRDSRLWQQWIAVSVTAVTWGCFRHEVAFITCPWFQRLSLLAVSLHQFFSLSRKIYENTKDIPYINSNLKLHCKTQNRAAACQNQKLQFIHMWLLLIERIKNKTEETNTSSWKSGDSSGTVVFYCIMNTAD